LGFATGWTVVKLVEKIFRRVNRQKLLGFQKCPGFGQCRHGIYAWRAGRTEIYGVFMLGVFLTQGQAQVTEFIIPNWMLILCSAVMATGTSIGGYRIIKAVEWTWSNLKISRFFCRPCRRDMFAYSISFRLAGQYHSYQDNGNYGRWSGKTYIFS